MAFVEPTRDASLSLSLTHSMLHQTFLSSSLFSFHPSSSATTPFLSRTSFSSSSSSSSSKQAEREAGMEAALRRTAVGAEALWGQQQQQQSGFSGDDVAWAGEQSSSLLGDEFSVDDLLDFGELMETEEKRCGEDGDEEDEEELDCEEEEAGGRNSNSTSALSFEPPPPTEIDVPADDVAELEWVSRFVDDSYSEYPSCAAVPPPPKPEARLEAKTKDNRQGHAFGIPAAPAEAATCVFSLVPVKAKRSKRPRSAGAAWSSRGSAFIDLSTSPSSSCSSSSSAPSACLVYDYYAGVGNPDLLPLEADPLAPPEEEPSQKKKRGRKPKLQQPPLPTPTPYAAVSSGGGERRCSHCGVQKTPQWRAGPLGPKTLCNACGVRYKSGRLLPEYRPACSPTFVSHIHSNSHRRVLEMRRKKEEHRLAAAGGGAASSSPEPALSEPVRFGSAGSGWSV